MKVNKPQVVFFHRKPYTTGNYSIEYIFSDVRQRLVDNINAIISECSFYSKGILRRFYNALESFFRQGDVNIITGDVHYLAFFLKKRKTILVILDCGFLHDNRGVKRILQKWFWLSLPLKRVKHVVTISDFVKKEIQQNSFVNPNLITVIPVSISEDFIYQPKCFNQDKPVLLQVGQAKNKNLHRIIDAIEGLSVQLVIIGKISEENFDRLKQKKIDFVNRCHLNHIDMLNQYLSCDMLLFPSTYEGFGMPIIEAQAVGRVVVTSNCASMPWVAGGGACFVDPFSVSSIRKGVIYVIENADYRNSLIQNGLDNIKRFNPELVAKMYLNLFVDVVSS